MRWWFLLVLAGWGENEESQETVAAETSCLHCRWGQVTKIPLVGSRWNSGATLGIVSFHVFYMSLRIAGGGGCPAPVDFFEETANEVSYSQGFFQDL